MGCDVPSVLLLDIVHRDSLNRIIKYMDIVRRDSLNRMGSGIRRDRMLSRLRVLR